ncbi:MAG: CHAT domain-containing protein [Anaerolineae bacterium]|nr:CHAT domain-containing protein [Anaerolineae bacterium]
MEDETGHSQAINAFRLGTLLHDHKSLRLAVLNACEGGRASRSDPFGGVCQSLLQQGIPAVIAMQFEVTDKTAIVLTHSFYQALADGYPVDAALAEARKSIFISNDLNGARRGAGGPVVSAAASDPFAAQALPERVPQTQTAIAPPVVPHIQPANAQAQPAQPADSTRQPARSRTWAWFGLTLALVALIGVIGWQFLPWRGVDRSSTSTASSITATRSLATLTAPTPALAFTTPTVSAAVPAMGTGSAPALRVRQHRTVPHGQGRTAGQHQARSARAGAATSEWPPSRRRRLCAMGSLGEV